MSPEALEKQPLGNVVTRCEENGRIRLPGNWLHFFTHDLGAKKVFTTSLDGSTIRVYPEEIWRANLARFKTLPAQSADVKRILTLANHFGVESTLETHGKVLIKQELRNKLAIAGSDVVLSGVGGVIHVTRKTDHDELIDSCLAVAADAVQNLTLLGME